MKGKIKLLCLRTDAQTDLGVLHQTELEPISGDRKRYKDWDPCASSWAALQPTNRQHKTVKNIKLSNGQDVHKIVENNLANENEEKMVDETTRENIPMNTVNHAKLDARTSEDARIRNDRSEDD